MTVEKLWNDNSIEIHHEGKPWRIMTENGFKSAMGKAASSNTVAPVDNIRWVKADVKPEYNVGVLVFIPDEDFHITSGMWDISNKWVLLDEYRVPDCEVTHWMPIPAIPDEYKKEQQENDEVMNFLSKHKDLLKNKK